MERIEQLNQRLKKIERELEEVRRRLPAHSVKPAMMAVLFDLEDERDAILKELGRRQAASG